MEDVKEVQSQGPQESSFHENSGEYFDANDEQVPVAAHEPGGDSPLTLPTSTSTSEEDPPEIEEDKDFYEDDNMQGIVSSNKSVIFHLLQQALSGVDFTRISLPAFLFERRSVLEMYSELFANFEFITRTSEFENPKDRITGILKWYISSLSSSRKVDVAKKPYNPILGERFCCYWDLPDGKRRAPNLSEQNLVDTGPFVYAGYDSLSFIAEQVSHHPPVSAVYLECPSKRVYIEGSIETKTKFTGLAVKMVQIGTLEIHFLNHDEVYLLTFPSVYVRSPLTTPWMEFGNVCTISCKKTGYTATIDFHTKPLRGGQKHRVTGGISHSSEKKPFMKFEGHWNNCIFRKISKDENEIFMDIKSLPVFQKKVKKFSLQEDFESRVVWRRLTEALKQNDTEAAATAKHEIEDAQREKAKEMKRNGTDWQPKHFSHESKSGTSTWKYNKNLKQRIKDISL